jgi:hypothetical protein
MSDPYAAFEQPPRIVAVDGEVVVTGPMVAAAYTPEAARAKAEMLLRVAREADRQRRLPAPSLQS